MKIKRFKARTFSEALEMVKKELSEEAIILSSEEKKGLRPYVEVTAAVDYEGLRGQGFKDSGDEVLKSVKATTHKLDTSSTPLFSFPFLDAGEIRKEIEKIKEALDEMRFSGLEINLPEKKRKVFHILRSAGIKEEFIFRLTERTRETGDIMDVIRSDIAGRVSGRWSRRDNRAIMLIGPTGVGKTTTVAKLAALALRERKRVAIINLDTYRIGAPEQIRTYARILGIPIQMASNSEELKEGLRRFLGERELVFIDTTGRSPKDEGYINQILSICSDVWGDRDISERFPLELHLLMNTNSDSDYIIEAYRYYRPLPVSFIAFTKIDEAVRYGNIYNMIMTYQRPVAYITTGQKVPDDIEFPDMERITELILHPNKLKR